LAVIWLSLIAFTGVMMIFWTPFENTVYWLVGETKPPEVTSQMVYNRPPMAIDEILSKAHAAFPKAVLWKFYPAKKQQDTFDIWLLFPKENAFNKDVYLSLDQYTGDILKARNAQEDSLAKRIIYSQYTLHTGQYGGWLIRWLYGIIGFVPLGLLITGLIWLREKYRSSRPNNHAHQ